MFCILDIDIVENTSTKDAFEGQELFVYQSIFAGVILLKKLRKSNS